MTSLLHPRQTIDLCLTPTERTRQMHDELRASLLRAPKELLPKYLYDERGGALFAQITTLPEYYLTARERALLGEHARTIAHAAEASTLVELAGSSAEKTRVLLDALDELGLLSKYVAMDVNETELADFGRIVCDAYPQIRVHGILGDVHKRLDHVPYGGRRLFAFLGSTVGNFYPDERARFFADLAAQAVPGDSFLLGTDLVKPVERLLAAYDDAQGVTEAFIKNALTVLNRTVGANFDVGAFEYAVTWNHHEARLELELESTRAQRVRLGDLDLDLDFAQGEPLRVEISAKFTRAQVESELVAAGFVPSDWWADADGDYALSLWRSQ